MNLRKQNDSSFDFFLDYLARQIKHLLRALIVFKEVSAVLKTMIKGFITHFYRTISTDDGNFKLPISWRFSSDEVDRQSLARIVLNGIPIEKFSFFLFTLTLIHSFYFLIRYVHLPYFEFFGFRQAQTALTSYYLIKNGFSLNYWTPVLGQPWSIPFEFPIYQEMVALLTPLLNIPLIEVGRSINWLTAIVGLIPLYKILNRLKIERSSRWFMLALYLSSPLYLFWSSTVLIEGTALLFLLWSIYFSVEIFCNRPTVLLCLGLLISLSLCLLQKITTGLPFVALIFLYLSRDLYRSKLKWSAHTAAVTIIVAASLFLGLAWVFYTDTVKAQNTIGSNLTNQHLLYWNYGDLAQRLSKDFWCDLLYYRILYRQLSGIFGLLLIAFAYFKAKTNERSYLNGALFLGLLPMVTFTNLYVYHDYYSVANLVFFYAALSFSSHIIFKSYLVHYQSLLALIYCFFIYENYCNFYNGYYSTIKSTPILVEERTYNLAIYVKNHTKPDDIVMWFGSSWSSLPAFFSERKSLALPCRQQKNLLIEENYLEDVFTHRERYLQSEPNLIVVCPYYYKDGTVVKIPPDHTADPEYFKKLIAKRYGTLEPTHDLNCDFYTIPKDIKINQ